MSNESTSNCFSPSLRFAIGFQCPRPTYMLVENASSHPTSRECRMNLESAINVDRIPTDRRPSGKILFTYTRVSVSFASVVACRVYRVNLRWMFVSVAFHQTAVRRIVARRKIRIRMRIIRKCDRVSWASNKSTGDHFSMVRLNGFGRNQMLILAADIDRRIHRIDTRRRINKWTSYSQVWTETRMYCECITKGHWKTWNRCLEFGEKCCCCSLRSSRKGECSFADYFFDWSVGWLALHSNINYFLENGKMFSNNQTK